jgi:hypothetical protein
VKYAYIIVIVPRPLMMIYTRTGTTGVSPHVILYVPAIITIIVIYMLDVRSAVSAVTQYTGADVASVVENV